MCANVTPPMLAWLAAIFLLVGAGTLASPAAFAQAVGSTVINPITGASEIVVQDMGNGSVLTNANNAIIIPIPAINSTIVSAGVTYTVVSYTSTAFGVSVINLTSGGPPAVPSTWNVATDVSGQITPPPPGTPGNPGGSVTVPIPAGNSNVYMNRQVGAQGAGGSNGYGVQVCIPLLPCFTIGYSGTSGSPGGAGPNLNVNLNNGNWSNPISSISNQLPGVTLTSIGGNGGGGGNSYGALPGLNGGAAGIGGSVSLVTALGNAASFAISTSGVQSHGVFAQSMGGSGGNGGTGYIFSGGGSGGPASAGSAVSVTNFTNISTTGRGAIGIFGQSIGGSGGSGGSSYGIVGGAGSASFGGNGSTVSVTNSAIIHTFGQDAHGILAQSVGGSGGNAGDAVGIVAFGAGPGAGGGFGSAVTVNNNAGGFILTHGNGAYGIFAQSIGGGGGNAGFSGGLVAFGGSGSVGGNAGSVQVTTQGGSGITTSGVGSHGIVAQSIGGGGGFGGTGGGIVAMGGSGSAGGSGSSVTVSNSGFITTTNLDAKGIFAQSIGGGGGGASGTGGIVALGGSGGSGGNAGNVIANNAGAITTSALGGDAIFAQSIGGGGGAGAASGGLVSIGGSGSSGGQAGSVSVTNAGNLTTTGARARGVFAQSIGGGGGAGGDSGGLVSIGGSGSVASNGNSVSVTNNGTIDTNGAGSHAIQAQSIGGGGGDGGSSGGAFSVGGSGGGGGNGGVVTIANNRVLSTSGNDANGIFAQSIGGGGGNGGNSGSVSAFAGLAIGGSGGVGGFGSATTINFSNFNTTIGGVPQSIMPQIHTLGDRSNGVMAQSIGGGGGNGGFAIQATAGSGASIAVGVGGSGGGGGQGGNVAINGNAAVTTQGDYSSGMVAQSIGGGGGNGGFAVAASVSTGYSVAVGVGGIGGSGGVGGAVNINTGGLISTDGNMSTGLVAQSIGGGGGNGGFSGSVAIGAAGLNASVGGRGGAGGTASGVVVGFAGNVTTGGANSAGITAQSIGGGGGNGGFAVGGAIGGAGISIGVGGSGGGGGTSNVAHIDSSGSVATDGANSIGLLAQSLGGGGGNGGFAAVGALASTGAVSVGVGGSGGGGQHASTASIYTDGGGQSMTVAGYGSGWSVATAGSNSAGLVAQSIGGGGGNGGFAGTLSLGGVASAGVALGGSGSGGGSAGLAIVQSGYGRPNANNIFTGGDNSSGIVAQSIGGGGGNGGFAGSLSGSGITGAVAVTLGGRGGYGGTGSTAEADSIGNITTVGNMSQGMLVQSIGGGGGNGGFSVALGGTGGGFGGVAAVGGNGGVGSHAGSATLRSQGNITTLGQQSNGLMAQSIGGGGGNGGFAGSGVLGLGGAGVALGIGGSGAGGGDASTVSVASVGNISTAGSQSTGIFAQSIGGGGGNGGSSVALAVSSGGSAAIAIGGSAADGGYSGSVTVTSTGNITTGANFVAGSVGNNAFGVLAQSIGGGGGNGGFAGSLSASGSAALGVSVGGSGGGGGSSSAVSVSSTGTISTAFDNSTGLLAQSIGGGGGNGGFAAGLAVGLGGASGNVSVGGFGGTGGNASTVVVNGANNIHTRGAQSSGILAQSIGGGGGNGGFSIGLAGGSSFAGSVSVGGFGGGGGTAAAVTAINTGTVHTQGADAYGIAAQSIGGGGGNGGFSIAGGFTVGSAGLGVSVGGFGAGGGNASDVTIQSYAQSVGGVPVPTAPAGIATLQTDGDRSHGILAQSLGGGGGNGGFSAGGAVTPGGGTFAASVGGFGAGGGSGGIVTVTSVNNIVTNGGHSNAILAQSLGGGGGNGGFSLGLAAGSQFAGALSVGGFGGGGGSAGAVTVTSSGTLLTRGDSSDAILAQSIGGGGGNGGFSLSGAFALQNAGIAISIGGTGGGGGRGGAVVVSRNAGVTLAGSSATIETLGQSSDGITAQSIGGGGGNGGFSGSFTATMNSRASVAISIGGFGAAGNSASTVGLTSVDNILTHGDGSNGILAQSIGGGGGNGGFSLAGSLSVPSGTSVNLAASLGGLGGSGGNAAAVTVNATGMISTLGHHADGILAQSIGGGGGNGGLSIAATVNGCPGCPTPSALTASVGGMGGSGGAADTVFVTRNGSIVTAGDHSAGLRAQSIGGGGGNGGLSVAGSISGVDAKQISASVGGFGGAGSNAGRVTVHSTGAITTGSITTQSAQVAVVGTVFENFTVYTGRESHGIVAQSIGGGGGNGGLSIAGGIGLVGAGVSASVGISVGGLGGSGGIGDAVIVGNNGLITTYGHAAHGVFAQSIGGGGGSGGGAITGLLAAGNPVTGRPVNVSVAVGGKGGSGNTAGNVTIDQTGGIQTSGFGAHGILAQSIGGGGGTGGNANSISLQLGSKCTLGAISGVIAACQSVPDDARGVNVQVTVGGFGGTGNDAGTVTVTNRDAIRTNGSYSSAIIAQSIGGGGGTGGNGIIGPEGLYPNPTPVPFGMVLIPFGTSGRLESLATVAVGGFGGAGGDGKAVTITNTGAITTTGATYAGGIRAQSIGGGGGDGGKASAGLLGTVAIGGYGAASGSGDSVTITNNQAGAIITAGTYSDGIFAQSIGGGGGDGGGSGGVIALGGRGGSSGAGGAVSVTNHAAMQTSGEFSSGIFAQSIGGGGGNGGGANMSGITIGGNGGSTGSGGSVTITNASTGNILTLGATSHAVFAQSIGGGGGNGGSNSLGAIVAVGGSGGHSGNGGHVTISNAGIVETRGEHSIGLYAQSIGGSGGTGGATLVSAISVGGPGGSSGDGGLVDVTNTGSITTIGAGADAIRAQSIGGGGGSAAGSGGTNVGLGLLVSVGGSGGGGGLGGAVSVTNSSILSTTGDQSNGIYAQSVGGGGGDGGRAIGLVAVGGSGGHTGDGGTVSVSNAAAGTIVTRGILSNGIFAQSVGGGGGNGGGAWSGSPIGVSTSVGGNGSGGGRGGAVAVDNFGQIQTDGAASQAIFAQSVGGGGGNGAIAGSFSAFGVIPTGAAVSVGGSGGGGGNGGVVTVTNRAGASIFTNGIDSTAIFAQSVGGGGGNGGYAISVNAVMGGATAIALGGSGGAGGDGGAVNVSNAGTININAKNSMGIMAQSVGGGGGTASTGLGVAVIPVAIGGSTGAVGHGGNVTVTNTGSINIAGHNSVGIFAQSVGGGGGMIKPGGGATSITLNNGGSGDGGNVSVTNTAGTITVTGENSIALYSQSVGGGGGAVGLAVDPPGQIGAFLFSGTAAGLGAAQATTIDQTGNLIATGFNSVGLVAQSSAVGGNGDITVNILNASAGQPSIIMGGFGQGAGVFILNGANNTLDNAGIITTVLGVDGLAVWGTTGNDSIVNTGMMIGSVDLENGVNSFANTTNATFLSGARVNLGAGNTLVSDGLMLPGDYQRVFTTNVTGNLVQTALGTYGVDLDLRTVTADRINVTGTAAVSGVARVNLIDPLSTAQAARSGTHDIVIVGTAGGETHPGLTLVAPNSVVATYSLRYPNGTDIVLNYTIDFTLPGMTANQSAVGGAINAIQSAQTSPRFGPIATALFFQTSASALANTYDALSGSATSGVQQLAFTADDQFKSAGMRQAAFWLSDEKHDTTGFTVQPSGVTTGQRPPEGYSGLGGPTGQAKLSAEENASPNMTRWRSWASGYAGNANFAGNAGVGSVAARQHGGGVSAGFDFQAAPGVLIGFATGGGAYAFSAPERATSGKVDAAHLGAYAAYRDGPFYVSGALAASNFENETNRYAAVPGLVLQQVGGGIAVPGFAEHVKGRFQSQSISGEVEAGYKMQVRSIEVTPFAGVQFDMLRTDTYDETMWNGDASLIGLTFADRVTRSLPTSLGLQLKTQAELGRNTELSAWARAAWRHEWMTDRSTESSFLAAPGFGFIVHGAQPQADALRASLGARVTLDPNVSLHTNFEGDFSRAGAGYTGFGGVRIQW